MASSRMVNFIIEEARKVGVEVKASLGKVKSVDKKLKHDIVTEIDYSTEKALLKTIRSAFPDHAVFTEELGFVGRKSSQYVWVIDPIDGTINYAAGLPFYNISIALTVHTKVVLGVIYDPLNDVIYFARRGHGAYVNGQKIDTKIAASSKTTLKDALVYVSTSTHDDLDLVDSTLNLWRSLHPNVRGVRMLGSSALGLAYVASGVFDAMIRLQADPWGAAAGSLLVQEAGGKFTTIDGKPWHVQFVRSKHVGFLATNRHLYDKIWRIVRQANGQSDQTTAPPPGRPVV